MKRKYQQRVMVVEMGSFLPPPLWFLAQTEEWGKNANFFEQPSGQTFPKQRRVVCQCHILA